MNPYAFNDLEEKSIHVKVKPELMIDSILVFIHRLYYFFMVAVAYIAFFIFDSLTVGRTLACVASFSYILEFISLLVLSSISFKRSKYNQMLFNMHRKLNGDDTEE